MPNYLRLSLLENINKYSYCSRLAAASGISSQVGSAHPTPLLAPKLNLVSHTLGHFQGELRLPQPKLLPLLLLAEKFCFLKVFLFFSVISAFLKYFVIYIFN
jgi:hypothetical protein